MDRLKDIDQVVMEYLLFRGFTKSFEEFSRERHSDRLKGLCPEKVSSELILHIKAGRFHAFWKLWSFLDARYFQELRQDSLAEAAVFLQESLLKYYIVCSYKQEAKEKLIELFDTVLKRYWQTHQEGKGWRSWCALPYIAKPQDDPFFAPYFDEKWAESLKVSLVNFLAQIFQGATAPRILAFNTYLSKLKSLHGKLRAADIEIERLKSSEHSRGGEPRGHSPAQAKSKGTQLQRIMPIVTAPQEKSKDQIPIQGDATRITGHSGTVFKCRVNANYVSTCSVDATTRIWDRSKEASTCIFSDSPVLCLDWWNPGQSDAVLALGSSSNSVRLWDVRRNKETCELHVSTPLLPSTRSIAFCPRSQLLVTSSCTNLLRYSPNLSKKSKIEGKYFQAYQNLEGRLELWNYTTSTLEKVLYTGNKWINSLAFNHNGTLLITGGGDGLIRIFDVSQGSVIMGWSATSDNSAIDSICITPDETAVVCLSCTGELTRWSLHKIRESLCTYEPFLSVVGQHECSGPLLPNPLVLGDMKFVPGTPNFVVCYPQSTSLAMYNVANLGEPVVLTTAHSSPITSLDVRDDLVFTASQDGAIQSRRLMNKLH